MIYVNIKLDGLVIIYSDDRNLFSSITWEMVKNKAEISVNKVHKYLNNKIII